MNTKRILSLFKREWWENKTLLLIVPISIVLICTLVYVVLTIGLDNISFPISPDQEKNALRDCVGSVCTVENGHFHFHIAALLRHEDVTLGNAILQFLYFNCAFVSLVLSIFLTIYALKSLFDDRVKKDILFWRSLPFSETENVLVKAAVITFVFPVVILLVNLLATLMGVFVGPLMGLYFGLSPSEIVAGLKVKELVTVPWLILKDNIYGMISLLPVTGFLLFSSAWSRKSPALPAFLIPSILVGISFTLDFIFGYDPIVKPIFGWYVRFLWDTSATFILRVPFEFSMVYWWQFTLSALVGTAFLIGAVWLRNHRYEI